jgi:FimV-like protein
MRKHLLLALVLSSSAQATENSYWEEVFNKSIERQAEAELANFSDFPLNKEPSSTFGMRIHPITQENKLHHGVDFPGAEGEPFNVVAHGEVIFAGDNGSLGMTISVDHGKGLITRYGHAKSLNYAVGDKVRRGDEIGSIGATGMVTGPHLHFEVIQDGEHIDPEAFIAQHRSLTVEEYKNQLINSPGVDIDNYVQHQLTNNQAISNETFEEFTVKKAVTDFEDSIHQKQVVESVEALQSQVDEFADANVQQILKRVSGVEEDDIGQLIPPAVYSENVQNDIDPTEFLSTDSIVLEPVDSELDVAPDAVQQENSGAEALLYTNRALWAIADEIKPDGATVYQSMFAIYELNPQAFSNGNMNQRFLERPIKLPTPDKISAVDPAAAKTKYYEDLSNLSGYKQPIQSEKETAPL